MAIKDIMCIIPPFTSPARIWAQKINLIWPTDDEAPTLLTQVIKLRLPPALFDALGESTFTSHITLLDKICSLDGPTSSQAAEHLFESKAQLRHNQSPREYFYELKRSIAAVFPSLGQESINTMAWKKLWLALPPSMQQTMALLPNQTVTDGTLDTVERAWRLTASTTCEVANVLHQEVTLNKLNKTLEDISARLQRLENNSQREGEHLHAANMAFPNTISVEAGIQNRSKHQFNHHSGREDHSEPICFYHRRFGSQAYKCTPPCKFHGAHQQAKGRGAPTP
jgi:hypothetical protein